MKSNERAAVSISDLARLQAELARSLAAEAPARGPALDSVTRARHALIAKRSGAAARQLTRLRAILGAGWMEAFQTHAARFQPRAMLYHVEDAWAFAESWRHHHDAAVRRAAIEDVLALRLRWTRSGPLGPVRIRPRVTPLVALVSGPPRALVLRGFGARAGVWRLALRRRSLARDARS